MGIEFQRQSTGGAAAGNSFAVFAKSGTYAGPVGTLGTNGTFTLDRMVLSAVDLPSGTALDQIGIEHTAVGGAGSVTRLVIYSDDGEGQPGALLLDAGTVDTTATAAFQTISISATTTTSRIHVGAIPQVGTVPTYRIVATTLVTPYRRSTPVTLATFSGLFQSSVTGAAPASFTESGAIFYAPLVQVRIA